MALDRIQKLTELAQKADPITESATGGVSANEDAFVNSAFDSNEGDGNVRTVKADEFDFGQYSNSNNIFAAGSSDSSSSIFSNYESQLNGMIKSAERYQKTMMLLSGISAGANLLNSAVDTVAGASSTGLSGNLFGNIGKLFGSGNKAAVADTAAASSSNLTSNLGAAISNYSSKGSTENWTALNNEIAKARTDRERLTQVVTESDAAVRKFNEEKPQLEQAVKNAQSKVNEAQTAVDNNKLGVQAEIRVNTIEKEDIPAQQTIIRESKARVETAQKTYNTDKSDAESKIKSAQSKIDANKDMAGQTPVPQKDQNGNITGYKPTQEQVSTAKRLLAEGQQELKAAQEKLEKAKKDWAAVLKTEVGSENIEAGVPANPTDGVQGKALARITELEAEKEQQAKIVEQNGGKKVVDKLIEARQEAQADLDTANDNLQKAKDEKDSAVTKSGQASAQIKVIDKQIKEAESLLSKKQK